MSMEILLSILGVTSTDAKDVWRLLFESMERVLLAYERLFHFLNNHRHCDLLPQSNNFLFLPLLLLEHLIQLI